MSIRSALAALWLASLLVPTSPALQAAPPVGEFTVALSGTESIILPGVVNIPLDLTEGTGRVQATTELTLTTDPRGKITGGAALDFRITDGANTIEGEFSGPVTGAIKSGGVRDAALTLVLALAGNATASGPDLPVPGPITVPARMKVAIKGTVNDQGVFTGREVFALRLPGPGGRLPALPFPVTAQLTGPFNWNLALDIADAGRGKLQGTATAALPDGSSVAFTVSGRYNAKKDEASIALKPQERAARGAALALKGLTFDGGSALSARQLSYRLSGQAGKAAVTGGPTPDPEPTPPGN